MKQPHTTHKTRRSSRRSSPNRILAINPGTRYMGVAFLIGRDLIRADVEKVRDAGMTVEQIQRKAEKILDWWIEGYRPDVIAVERLSSAQKRQSRQLPRLVKTIKAVARRQGLRVQEYSPKLVRRFICRDGGPTKMEVARILATEYFRWLAPFYEKEATKSWYRQRYWTQMFDAIAVGLTYYGQANDEADERRTA